jgi:hypothetical protein
MNQFLGYKATSDLMQKKNSVDEAKRNAFLCGLAS